MLTPRNTLCTVVEFNPGEKKVGNIIMPEDSGEFRVCRLIKKGPGTRDEKDERNPDDLAPGMLVLVKTHDRMPGRTATGHPAWTLKPAGVEFTDEQNRNLVLVDQSQILAIIDEDQYRTMYDQQPSDNEAADPFDFSNHRDDADEAGDSPSIISP